MSIEQMLKTIQRDLARLSNKSSRRYDNEKMRTHLEINSNVKIKGTVNTGPDGDPFYSVSFEEE